MKIKITHDTGLVLRLDIPAKSVDMAMEVFSKFIPSLVTAMPSVFQQAQEQAALKEQEAAAKKAYEEAIAARPPAPTSKRKAKK